MPRVFALALVVAAATGLAAQTRPAPGVATPPGPDAPTAAEDARAIEAAIAPLAGYTRDLPLRLLTAVGWTGNSAPTVWAVAEAGPGEDWMGGGDAGATLIDRAGATVASARAAIDPGARSVRMALTPSTAIEPGEYELQLRVKGAGSASATPAATRVSIAAAPNPTGVLFLRHGPTTGNQFVPTADLRFRRSEQLTIEVPAASSDAVRARLLDRTGKPLTAIPVAASTRVDADGSRWIAAQLSLVPLGVGDYVIELTATAGGAGNPGEMRTLAAFRVVP